jgi:hypothetical protein
MAMSTGDLAEVETETLLSESLATPEGRRRLAATLGALVPTGMLPDLAVPTNNTLHRRRLVPLDVSAWSQSAARRRRQSARSKRGGTEGRDDAAPKEVEDRSWEDVVGRMWKVTPDRFGLDTLAVHTLDERHALVEAIQFKSKMSDETDGKPDVGKAAQAVNLGPLVEMVRALKPEVQTITVIVALVSTHALDSDQRSAWRAHEPPVSRSRAGATRDPAVECHWVVLDCNDMCAGPSIFTDKMIEFATVRNLPRFRPKGARPHRTTLSSAASSLLPSSTTPDAGNPAAPSGHTSTPSSSAAAAAADTTSFQGAGEKRGRNEAPDDQPPSKGARKG